MLCCESPLHAGPKAERLGAVAAGEDCLCGMRDDFTLDRNDDYCQVGRLEAPLRRRSRQAVLNLNT